MKYEIEKPSLLRHEFLSPIQTTQKHIRTINIKTRLFVKLALHLILKNLNFKLLVKDAFS